MIELIGLGLWIGGLLLHTLGGGYKNVHTSFRTVWGARAICIGVIISTITIIFTYDLTTFRIVQILFNIVIFIMYAIDEYGARGIFQEQAKEYFNKTNNN